MVGAGRVVGAGSSLIRRDAGVSVVDTSADSCALAVSSAAIWPGVMVVSVGATEMLAYGEPCLRSRLSW